MFLSFHYTHEIRVGDSEREYTKDGSGNHAKTDIDMRTPKSNEEHPNEVK